MKLTFCVACGSRQDLHHHHLIPKSRGGSGSEKNLITLCSAHHMAFHVFQTSVEHSSLVKEGIERARMKGTFLGPKPPSIEAFSHSSKTRIPADNVLVHLFSVEKLPVALISELRWLDVMNGEVTLPAAGQQVMAPQTKAAIDHALRESSISGPSLALKITATRKRPEGLLPSALAMKLNRLKNANTKRSAPRGPQKLKPLSREDAIKAARSLIR